MTRQASQTQGRTTRWWHIRHAPVPNPDGTIYGRLDRPADTGDDAAFAALARLLPTEAAVVVSSLQRTRQTAAAIAEAAGRPADWQVEPDLAEQDLGDWQGRTPAEAYAEQGMRHPFWLCPGAARPPGGESFGELMGRVHPVLHRLSRAHLGGDIVAVTHGGVIRAALALALDLSAETALRFTVDNLSITRIDYIERPEPPPLWRVIRLNAPPQP